ncbi:hypothetical protein CLOM_g15472, partial [Closterium sp. NIES-68]
MATTRTGVYVDDFLAEVSSLPHELQRMLSLMRELDGRCQALRSEIQSDIRVGLTAIEEREAAHRGGDDSADDGEVGGEGDGESENGGDDSDDADSADAADDAAATGALDATPAPEPEGGGEGEGAMRDEQPGDERPKRGGSDAQDDMSPLPGSAPALKALVKGTADEPGRQTHLTLDPSPSPHTSAGGGGGERRPRGRPRKRGRGEREGGGGEGWVGGSVKAEEEMEEGGTRKSIGKKRPRAQHQQQQQQQQQQVREQEGESKEGIVVVKAEAAAAVHPTCAPSHEGRLADGAGGARPDDQGVQRDDRHDDVRNDVSGDVSDEKAAALQRLREEISEKQQKMQALCDEKVILAQQVSALLESHLRSLNQELLQFEEDLKQDGRFIVDDPITPFPDRRILPSSTSTTPLRTPSPSPSLTPRRPLPPLAASPAVGG